MEYDPVFAEKPYAADHEHKFVRINRYLEACQAGDGCQLGRVSREWLAQMRFTSKAPDKPSA